MDIAKQIVDQRVNKIIEENTHFFEETDREKKKLFYCWEFPHIWISISRKLSNTLQMAEMMEDLMQHILLKHRILN